MNSRIENNLESIKNQIKNGQIPSNCSINDAHDVRKLHKEYLAIKSIECPANSDIYKVKINMFNDDLDVLAGRLNVSFVKNQTQGRIMDVLNFDKTLKERLTSQDYNIYKTMLENKFAFDEIKVSFENNNFNVYDSVAKLNGFNNILEYTEEKIKKKKQEEETKRLLAEKNEFINKMKQAFKEALKEHKEGI